MAHSPCAMPITARSALPLAVPAAGLDSEAGTTPGPRCPR